MWKRGTAACPPSAGKMTLVRSRSQTRFFVILKIEHWWFFRHHQNRTLVIFRHRIIRTLYHFFLRLNLERKSCTHYLPISVDRPCTLWAWGGGGGGGGGRCVCICVCVPVRLFVFLLFVVVVVVVVVCLCVLLCCCCFVFVLWFCCCYLKRYTFSFD